MKKQPEEVKLPVLHLCLDSEMMRLLSPSSHAGGVGISVVSREGSLAPAASVTQQLYLSLPLTHLCDLEKSHLKPLVSLFQFLQNRKVV